MYLGYASETLKNDKELMLYALQLKDNVFQYTAGEDLKKEVGNNDPIAYLTAYFLKQKLNLEVLDNNSFTSIRKNKL